MPRNAVNIPAIHPSRGSLIYGIWFPIMTYF